MNKYLTAQAVKKRGWEIPVGILSIILTVIAIETWIEDSPVDESFLTWMTAHLFVVGLMALPLYFIVRHRLRQRDARRIADKLITRTEPSIPLVALDQVLGMKGAARTIEDLKAKGFLQRLESDGESLLLDNPEPEYEPQEAPPVTGDVIQQIRYLNDEIADEAVSERIDRIERVTASILRTVRERPERADDARRFMNYYLPTTLKLLESYRLMEKQSYQG